MPASGSCMRTSRRSVKGRMTISEVIRIGQRPRSKCPPCAVPPAVRDGRVQVDEERAVRLRADAPLRRDDFDGCVQVHGLAVASADGVVHRDDHEKRGAPQAGDAADDRAGADPVRAAGLLDPGDEIGPGGEPDEDGRADVGGGMQDSH